MVLDTGAIYLPNLFTPNLDGTNDFLFPYTTSGIEKVNAFIVKDDDNNTVFQSLDVLGFPFPSFAFGWNGRDINGDILHGRFFVELTVTTVLGTTESFNTSVCSHPCDGLADPIENGLGCNFGTQHDGLGGLDVNLPNLETDCF